MKASQQGGVWAIAVAGGLLLVGGAALLFRGARMDPAGLSAKPPSAAKLPVGLVVPGTEGGADRLLKEEALLRDPTPLFLPTEWNASESGLTGDLRREPGSQFENYPARLEFGEAELRLKLPAAVAMPARAAEALALDKPVRPFAGLGETDLRPPALEARAGFVEVAAAGDGRLMLAEALGDANPPGEASWQPLEFLVTIDAAGLVRPPVLTASSRVSTVDNYFQDFLGKVLHIGERLPPGYYRVTIGP